MEAQLQRRQIGGTFSLAIAMALAAALVIGAGVGYEIGTTFQAKTVQMVPGSGDDLASDTTTTWDLAPAKVRDEEPFLSGPAPVPQLHDGVQITRAEYAEAAASSDDSANVDLPDLFGRGPR